MAGERILVVRLGAMGDIIHALPAAASLKQSFPHSRLTWAVQERWAELLRGNPFIDEIATVNRRSLRSMLELTRRLRASRFDFAVDFQGLLQSAVLASIARAERIYGFHRSQTREPLAALFYSHTVRATPAHIVERNWQLAEAAGATSRVRTAHIPPGHPEGTLPSTPFVLASPFAGWASKQWPLDKYSQLGDRLAREHGLTLVLNVPAPLAQPPAHVQLHVSSLAGLLHATRTAIAVVGVDSGPMHLAAALGKTGVAIFGPTDPARNGPYGDSLLVLRSPAVETTYKRGRQIHPGMHAISAGAVLDALLARIAAPVR